MASAELHLEAADKVFQSFSSKELLFRKITKADMVPGYFDLLGELTKLGNFVPEQALHFYEKNIEGNPYQITMVIMELGEDGKEVGYAATGTMIIMPKLFRGLAYGSVLEDIVVSSKHRGKGMGKKLIDCLKQLAHAIGCYKTVLYCNPELEKFYTKCEFGTSGILLSHYFPENN